MLAGSWLLAPLLGSQNPAAPAAKPEGEAATAVVEPASESAKAEVCARIRISTDSTHASFRDAIEAQVADLELPTDFGGEGLDCERHVSFGLRRDQSDAYFEIFVEDTLLPTQRIVRTLGAIDMNVSARDEMFALIVRRCLVAALAGENIEVEQARIEARELTGGAFDEEGPELPPEQPDPVNCDECAQPPPVEVEPPPPPPRARRNWFRLDVDYLGRTWADEVPWQSSPLVAIGWEHISGIELQAGASMTRAIEVDDEAVFFRVTPFSSRLLAGYRYSWDRSSVAASAGVLVDQYRRKTLGRQSGFLEEDDTPRSDVGGFLGADADVRIFGPLHLHGGIGAQWFPRSFDFVVKGPGDDRNLLTVHPVRFELRLGLRVQI